MRYNMRGVVAAVILSVMAMAGCQGHGNRFDTKEAVRQAVETHLKGNSQLMLNNFTTSVQSVKFKGDTADALVKFKGKDSAGASVLVRYQLKRSGEQWQVVSDAPAGGQGMHGDMGTPPSAQGAPPAAANAPPASKNGQIAPDSSH